MPNKVNGTQLKVKTSVPKGPQKKPVNQSSTGPADLSPGTLHAPGALSPAKVLALQRISGNRAVQRLLAQLQMQDKPLAGSIPTQAQRTPADEEELQTKSASSTGSFKATPDSATAGGQRPNRTGLPDGLKSGVESLSGVSLDDVKVHFNSALPRSFKAHAIAQGSDIHLGPGEERSLPHEAWHVVQQKLGRVQPNIEINHSLVNADAALEGEATEMGRKAAALDTAKPTQLSTNPIRAVPIQRYPAIMQMDWYEKVGDQIIKRTGQKPGGYRLVKGVKTEDGDSVFETKEQRQTHVEAPKTRAELVAALPNQGEFLVDSKLVMFSQDTIGRKFTSGVSVYDTAEALTKGTISASKFPPIRIFKSDGGRLVTLDNRRLWCCKQAGVEVKCTWATEAEIEKEDYKFTSGKGFEGKSTIEVRKT